MSSRTPRLLVCILTAVVVCAMPTAQQAAPGWLGVFAGAETWPTVAEVVPGSPAAAAGLRPGDEVLALDGQATATVERLVDLLGGRRAGTSVRLRLRRAGKELEVSVRLAARPPDGSPRPLPPDGAGDSRGRDGAPAAETAPDAPVFGWWLRQTGQDAVVLDLLEGAPAASAGLQVGDRLVGYCRDVQAAPVGSDRGALRVTVVRRGRPESFEVELEPRSRMAVLRAASAARGEGPGAGTRRTRPVDLGAGPSAALLLPWVTQGARASNLRCLLLIDRPEAEGSHRLQARLASRPILLRGMLVMQVTSTPQTLEALEALDVGSAPAMCVLDGGHVVGRLAADAQDAELDRFLWRHAWRERMPGRSPAEEHRK